MIHTQSTTTTATARFASFANCLNNLSVAVGYFVGCVAGVLLCEYADGGQPIDAMDDRAQVA